MNDEINFFPEISTGPKQPRIQPLIIYKIIALRKDYGLSVTEIKQNLFDEGHNVSISTIDRILTQAGFEKLHIRFQKNANDTLLFPTNKATNLEVAKLKPFKIDCPIAGVYFLIPYIVESGIIDIVKECKLPSSSKISSIQANLSILLLKSIGNERLSDIQAYDQEPAFGIFAGLNILPKATFMTTYSCRTSELMLQQLQQKVVSNFRSQYPDFYQAKYINLDFHSIPHFGTESQMEKVWCGSRGKTLKGANVLLAQDGNSDVILYTKADVLRKNETQEIKKFVDYWKNITGSITETLVFDCKLTTYQVLGELDQEQPPIKFITLRKRNQKLLTETALIEEYRRQKVHLPIPKRKHQDFLAHESKIKLKGCVNMFRQIAIKGHGREKPTFVITNNWELKLTEVLEVYAKRWHIENKIAEFVSFFNINALSSPLMVRIHFDIFWTVIAATLYHRFAQDLPRFEKCQAKTIFRQFINFPGQLEFNGNQFFLKIRKRTHTPILLGVEKLNQPFEIPWLNNMTMTIIWTA
jgi:hypothetical protein